MLWCLQVGEIQRLDHQVKEYFQQLATFAEKLVSQRMGKQQYVDNEKVVLAKKDECCHKIESILVGF